MWSSDVFPIATYNDEVDRGFRNIKSAAQPSLGALPGRKEALDFSNLPLCKFGASIPFANTAANSRHHICD